VSTTWDTHWSAITWDSVLTWKSIVDVNTWANGKDVITNITNRIPWQWTTEFEKAYNFAKLNWITTMPTIQKASMYTNITRIQMAKMLSYYAVNILWQTPDTSRWNPRFGDVTEKLDKQYDNWVTLAYQLWIMWINMKNNEFRPYDEVTRAEFATALSRLLYKTEEWEYKWTRRYYEPHIEKLYKEWIITKKDPNLKEKRWYVMIMLMRSANKS
jgi:hypothetical protein